MRLSMSKWVLLSPIGSCSLLLAIANGQTFCLRPTKNAGSGCTTRRRCSRRGTGCEDYGCYFGWFHDEFDLWPPGCDADVPAARERQGARRARPHEQAGRERRRVGALGRGDRSSRSARTPAVLRDRFGDGSSSRRRPCALAARRHARLNHLTDADAPFVSALRWGDKVQKEATFINASVYADAPWTCPNAPPRRRRRPPPPAGAPLLWVPARPRPRLRLRSRAPCADRGGRRRERRRAARLATPSLVRVDAMRSASARYCRARGSSCPRTRRASTTRPRATSTASCS